MALSLRIDPEGVSINHRCLKQLNHTFETIDGFEFDRLWMVVEDNKDHKFVTQREAPKLVRATGVGIFVLQRHESVSVFFSA